MDTEVGRRIPSGTDTRWSSVSKTLSVIVEEWEGMKRIFEKVMKYGVHSSNAQAKGFLNEFNDFEFTFLAQVFKEIFDSVDILFQILQKKSLDVSYCITKINDTKEILVNKRNEGTCKRIFLSSLEKTKIPVSRRFTTEEECFQNVKMLFFEILDTILMEITDRFQDLKNLKFLQLADTKRFEEYIEVFPVDALKNLTDCYPQIFPKPNIEKLKNELYLIYRDVNYKNSNIDELVKSLKKSGMDEIYEQSYKLFSLVLTLPSTSASVERSFSCLKRIKTYLRNALSQDRLSSLATICIHKDLLANLMKNQPFYEDIIDAFAALKDRRINLIYKH